MGVADDIDKLEKNQLAMQKTLTALKSRVDVLGKRVAELEGDDVDADFVPVKETKKAVNSTFNSALPSSMPAPMATASPITSRQNIEIIIASTRGTIR